MLILLQAEQYTQLIQLPHSKELFQLAPYFLFHRPIPFSSWAAFPLPLDLALPIPKLCYQSRLRLPELFIYFKIYTSFDNLLLMTCQEATWDQSKKHQLTGAIVHSMKTAMQTCGEHSRYIRSPAPRVFIATRSV